MCFKPDDFNSQGKHRIESGESLRTVFLDADPLSNFIHYSDTMESE